MSTSTSSRATKRATAPVRSRALDRFAAAVALLGLWLLLARLNSQSGIADPIDTGASLVKWSLDPDFWRDVLDTLSATLLGLGVAMVLSVPLGLLIGASDFAARSSRMTIGFLASIPPIALIPLALLLYGPSLPMKLLLIIYGALWPLLMRTIDAMRDIDATQRDVAQAFSLRRRTVWSAIYLPAALPGILLGTRVAMTFALLFCIAGEYIGGASGIGGELITAQVNGRADDALALAVFTAILGLGLGVLIDKLTQKLIPWHPSIRLERAA